LITLNVLSTIYTSRSSHTVTCSAKKVVVACKDTEHLFDLKDDAINAGLKCAYITDAGLTQVKCAEI